MNPEGILIRRLRENFEGIMDETTSELMSQVFGKHLHECHKRDQLVREVALELQTLSTGMYHVCRDGMQLQKHLTRHSNSRKILEDGFLQAFKSSTKYAKIFSEIEDLLQEFFSEFMGHHHVGLGYTGAPVLKVNFDTVKFTNKGKLQSLSLLQRVTISFIKFSGEFSTEDLTEDLEEAASNLDVLPRGVTQPIAPAKDMVDPIGGPNLDAGFDLMKRIQSSRRRILGAREYERTGTRQDNPPKRQNTRSGLTSRRGSARNLQADFQSPDLSFLQNLASRSDGFNSSSSSGHCEYANRFLHFDKSFSCCIFKVLIVSIQVRSQVLLQVHLQVAFACLLLASHSTHALTACPSMEQKPVQKTASARIPSWNRTISLILKIPS